MTRTPLQPHHLLLLLGALLLQGCGASGPAREDSYYRLELSATPTAIASPYPGTVLVTRPDGRGFAGDRAIIFREAGKLDQVQRYTYHLWAEAPTLSIQDLLAGYLRSAGIADFVVTPNQRVRADLIITGTLFLMEHRPYDSPPRVLVDIELGVVRTDRRQPLLLKRYQSSATTGDEQLASAIPAFNQALDDIFARFLSDLEAALPALDPPRNAPRSR